MQFNKIQEPRSNILRRFLARNFHNAISPQPPRNLPQPPRLLRAHPIQQHRLRPSPNRFPQFLFIPNRNLNYQPRSILFRRRATLRLIRRNRPSCHRNGSSAMRLIQRRLNPPSHRNLRSPHQNSFRLSQSSSTPWERHSPEWRSSLHPSNCPFLLTIFPNSTLCPASTSSISRIIFSSARLRNVSLPNCFSFEAIAFCNPSISFFNRANSAATSTVSSA